MRVSLVSKLTSAWLAGVALLAIVLATGVRYTLTVRDDLRACRRAEESLAAQTVTDDLTGLLNQRGFDHVAAHALAHAQRAHEWALVLYVDMDAFKAIRATRSTPRTCCARAWASPRTTRSTRWS
jgi:two-component system, cell cycle response regulator